MGYHCNQALLQLLRLLPARSCLGKSFSCGYCFVWHSGTCNLCSSTYRNSAYRPGPCGLLQTLFTPAHAPVLRCACCRIKFCCKTLCVSAWLCMRVSERPVCHASLRDSRCCCGLQEASRARYPGPIPPGRLPVLLFAALVDQHL